MALKRLPEKTWNSRKVKEPYPQAPGSGLFLAPSGQGKTSTICALICGPYSQGQFFDESHVYSPSCDIDSAWDPVREFAKGLKHSSFHSEWDEKSLWEIMDRQKARIKELKLAKSKKPMPQILIVVDDWADRPDIMHSASNILTTLFIRGRHLYTSCWLSSQVLSTVHPVARKNLRFLVVWRLRNKKELVDSLLYELSALFPLPVLLEMYRTATEDADHSFWFIDLMAKKKEDMSWVRFEKRMVVNTQVSTNDPVDTNDALDPARLEDGNLLGV